MDEQANYERTTSNSSRTFEPLLDALDFPKSHTNQANQAITTA
jgi:hypothetical protein